MHTFKDTLGRKWVVELNIGVMALIRDALKTDLANITDESFGALSADNIRLCEIIGHCARMLDAGGADESVPLAFALGGDALGAARTAFNDELIAFFPNERERAVVARVVEAMNTAKAHALTLIEKEIESGELQATIEAAMAEAIQEARGASSGSSPESPESIPALSPSENSA